MTEHVVIPLDLAQNLLDLLNHTIEYDTDGEPIDADHSAYLDDKRDLELSINEFSIKRSEYF